MEFAERLKIKNLKNVQCLADQFRTVPTKRGTINISSHILCYESFTTKIQLQHSNIHRIDRIYNKCVIFCKNFDQVTFIIKNSVELALLVETLENLSCIKDLRLSLPFYCKPRSQEHTHVGYDEVQELAWLEFPPPGWAVEDFTNKICTSWYGPISVVPTSFQDEDDMSSLAECRVECRYPRPTYLYKHGKHETCIVISAGGLADSSALQYKIQDRQYRDIDARYMEEVVKLTKSATLLTADSFRERITKRQYPGWNIEQIKLPSVSDLHAYIVTMTCKDDWLAGNKKWLDAVWDVCRYLDLMICLVVEKKHSLLLEHYPNLLSSLLQICLESRYRTLYGLQALLHKEWLYAGYKFSSERDNFCTEFLLFLACTHQLITWYPRAFQYSEHLLVFLHDNANSSKFGDFLGDCEGDRRELGVAEKTVSIWSYILDPENRRELTNPAYKPRAGLIRPRLAAPQSVAPWSQMFCRNGLMDVYKERVRRLRWKIHSPQEHDGNVVG